MPIILLCNPTSVANYSPFFYDLENHRIEAVENSDSYNNPINQNSIGKTFTHGKIKHKWFQKHYIYNKRFLGPRLAPDPIFQMPEATIHKIINHQLMVPNFMKKSINLENVRQNFVYYQIRLKRYQFEMNLARQKYEFETELDDFKRIHLNT